MPYIEGFVAAVPTANREAYIEHAKEGARVLQEPGRYPRDRNLGRRRAAGRSDRLLPGHAGKGRRDGHLQLDRISGQGDTRRREREDERRLRGDGHGDALRHQPDVLGWLRAGVGRVAPRAVVVKGSPGRDGFAQIGPDLLRMIGDLQRISGDVRLGIADHLGWAVAVTASPDHEVVDRRRIELIEPGIRRNGFTTRAGVSMSPQRLRWSRRCERRSFGRRQRHSARSQPRCPRRSSRSRSEPGRSTSPTTSTSNVARHMRPAPTPSCTARRSPSSQTLVTGKSTSMTRRQC